MPREAPPTRSQSGGRDPQPDPEVAPAGPRSPTALPNGSLLAGGVLESVSCDCEAYIAPLLSTDSGPEGHGPRRMQRARRPLVCLQDPDVRFHFRTIEAGHFYPWDSDLGIRLCTYRRELNGVVVYHALVAWPGPLEAHSGLRTGDLIRAAPYCRPEGVPMGYEHPAVAVCLLGPGSAGPVPAQRFINPRGDLAEALAAPGAVACFVRGNSRSRPHGGRPRTCLAPHDELPAAGPDPGMAPDDCQPCRRRGPNHGGAPPTKITRCNDTLLAGLPAAPAEPPRGHESLEAARASRDGNDTTVSVPSAAGAPSVFPICMAQLLARPGLGRPKHTRD